MANKSSAVHPEPFDRIDNVSGVEEKAKPKKKRQYRPSIDEDQQALYLGLLHQAAETEVLLQRMEACGADSIDIPLPRQSQNLLVGSRHPLAQEALDKEDSRCAGLRLIHRQAAYEEMALCEKNLGDWLEAKKNEVYKP